MLNKVVNDFSITVATVNGSGSQTANTTILRALFKMGIPVSGKNLFPSNIQGQPTWYTIRLSKDGYLARREEQEIVVAMNPASFVRDLAGVIPGGVFFYPDDIKLPITRTDITAYKGTCRSGHREPLRGWRRSGRLDKHPDAHQPDGHKARPPDLQAGYLRSFKRLFHVPP
jgi:Pyruvate/2-oxoacid:ferredoxin oxidoreductase gamma subunit